MSERMCVVSVTWTGGALDVTRVLSQSLSTSGLLLRKCSRPFVVSEVWRRQKAGGEAIIMLGHGSPQG